MSQSSPGEKAFGMDPNDLEQVKALYDAQIFYMDRGLKQLFQAIENLRLMERTILVIVSDHGHEFGEHGMYATHEQCYYNEVMRSVLIIKAPHILQRGNKVHQIAQLLDVMPTILELLDSPIPGSVQGRSLVPLLQTGRDPGREEVAITAAQGVRTIRTPQWTLISRNGNAAELYRVPRDPKKQRNLIRRYPDIAAQLQHRLSAVMEAEEAGEHVDAEQWMREQGYW